MRLLDQHGIDILRFIERYQNKNGGVSPSLDEVSKATGIRAKSDVRTKLRKLVKDSYLKIIPGKARGIILLRTADGYPVDRGNYNIPIWGFVSAGSPIPSPDNNGQPVDWIEVPRSMIPDSADVYGLWVKGDSMIDALVNHGDTVLIRQTQNANNNDLVVARLFKDPTHPVTTFKRFSREGNDVLLKPENPQFIPIHVRASQVEIQGIVLKVLRDGPRNSSPRMMTIR